MVCRHRVGRRSWSWREGWVFFYQRWRRKRGLWKEEISFRERSSNFTNFKKHTQRQDQLSFPPRAKPSLLETFLFQLTTSLSTSRRGLRNNFNNNPPPFLPPSRKLPKTNSIRSSTRRKEKMPIAPIVGRFRRMLIMDLSVALGLSTCSSLPPSPILFFFFFLSSRLFIS